VPQLPTAEKPALELSIITGSELSGGIGGSELSGGIGGEDKGPKVTSFDPALSIFELLKDVAWIKYLVSSFSPEMVHEVDVPSQSG